MPQQSEAMNKRFFDRRVVCLGMLILGLPLDSFACRCVESMSPATAYQQAQVVISGRVLSVAGDINQDGATARIQVLKSWKKSAPQAVAVSTRTTCAFDFHAGEEYLLYVQETAGAFSYTTKRCVGNLPLSQANKALEWLSKHGTHEESEK